MTTAPIITITIETGNAAFAEYPAAEVSRILLDLAGRLARDETIDATIPLRDFNGNTVG